MNIRVINRKSIPTISKINVDGEEHYIGEVQPFSGSETFTDFMKQGTTGISFVRLQPGEEHKVHTHDVNSLLIVTAGKATLLGPDSRPVAQNDVICIDAGAEHGFCCDLGEGLEGISIQFDSEALFENTPNIEFAARPLSTADRLIAYNEEKCRDIESSPFFELFRNGTMQDEDNMTMFKARLRQWSGLFQHIMYSRQFSTVDKLFSGIFLEHLKEELGHDEMLPETGYWDPEIDAFGNWFVLKMLQLDNLEKLVVVHLVLEKCADVFHSFAKRYISESGEYIDAHAELDHEHSELGKELYDNLTEEQYVRMERLCEHSWHMLELLLNRVAVLTLQDIGAKGRSKEVAMA